MTPDEMRALLRKRPFEPFRVYLKDGQALEVRYPRINLVTQQTFVIGIHHPTHPDPLIAEDFVYVGWSFIDKGEPIPLPATI